MLSVMRFESEIGDYLEMFRRGDTDDAFHGLLELDPGVIPELMAVFRRERDARVREFLVEVIWEYREPSVVPFLGEALLDSEPCVWQEALNGLVTLVSPKALDVLRAARTREFPTRRETQEFREWLEEAIEQVEEEK
jgi:hypothetical protein